jgi:hypothetical protein
VLKSSDGVIEAIELPGHSFAIGIQWHQERYVASNHGGNRIFRPSLRRGEVARLHAPINADNPHKDVPAFRLDGQ